MRTNNYIGKLLITATVLLLSLLSSACYREHNPSRFQLKDTLYVADTLTAQQQDSINFAHRHHYSENFNFIVRADTLFLLRQQPEEHVSEMPTDSFAVSKGTRMVVADIRIIPDDPTDTVWVQLATEQLTFGWAHESRLLSKVDPDDPISQFISLFSDKHTLIFLVVISLIAVTHLVIRQRRQRAKIVHFNDIPSFYPTLLVLIVAASATFYASIQLFAPDMWRHFYFHPSLNPFGQPLLIEIFLLSVWAMLIVGLAVVDDTLRCLRAAEALLYLLGVAAVCAFNYIVFSISTLYYIGYPLLLAYIIVAVSVYQRNSSRQLVCGRCGARLPKKGRCPRCGAVNE